MKTKVWDERFKCWCCGTETTFGTLISAALDGRSFECLVCRVPLLVVSTYREGVSYGVSWAAELDDSIVRRLEAAIAYAELLARGGGSGPAAVGLERIALGLA